jgi:hypothetical protein
MKFLRLLFAKTSFLLSPLPHNPHIKRRVSGFDYLTSDFSGGSKGEGLRILLACS